MSIKYLQLKPGSNPPNITSLSPFQAVVVIEEESSASWQEHISNWLVSSGCLYLMAWGLNCSSWDDSVDIANLQAHNFGDIPEDKFVMTTWHEDEPVSEAFWYSKNNAMHPTVDIENVLILHIASKGNESELLSAYASA
jgi:hypothetical protein